MPTRFRLHRNGSSLSGSSMECRVLMELGWDSGNGYDTTQGSPKRSPLTGVTQRRGISAPLGERGSPLSKIIVVVVDVVVVEEF